MTRRRSGARSREGYGHYVRVASSKVSGILESDGASVGAVRWGREGGGQASALAWAQHPWHPGPVDTESGACYCRLVNHQISVSGVAQTQGLRPSAAHLNATEIDAGGSNGELSAGSRGEQKDIQANESAAHKSAWEIMTFHFASPIPCGRPHGGGCGAAARSPASENVPRRRGAYSYSSTNEKFWADDERSGRRGPAASNRVSIGSGNRQASGRSEQG